MPKNVDRALAALKTELEKRLAEDAPAAATPALGPPDLLGDRIERAADGKPVAIVHHDGSRTPLGTKPAR